MLGAGAPDFQLFHIVFRLFLNCILVTPLDGTAQVLLEVFILDLHGRKGDVPLQRLIEQQTHPAPIFADKRHSGIKEVAGIVQINLISLEGNLPAGREQAHCSIGNTELALPGHASDTQDFSLMHLKAHIPYRLTGHIHPQIFNAENHRRFLVIECTGLALGSIHITPHHPTGNIGDDNPLCRDRLDDLAVTHDHDGVAHINNLLKTVGDENYGNSGIT
ncbi:hypothetical protein SDC9_155974 [bioreactor metagenome]|uniref:Uncharacterized protein n=1 Tax=bioreactor metagenome TaxID=1076179 RepID=A0A645F5J7_9ZZZZ